jgi:hypothetical protein
MNRKIGNGQINDSLVNLKFLRPRLFRHLILMDYSGVNAIVGLILISAYERPCLSMCFQHSNLTQSVSSTFRQGF